MTEIKTYDNGGKGDKTELEKFRCSVGLQGDMSFICQGDKKYSCQSPSQEDTAADLLTLCLLEFRSRLTAELGVPPSYLVFGWSNILVRCRTREGRGQLGLRATAA